MFKNIIKKNDYAFFFQVNNEQAFALANVLVQLNKKSPIATAKADILLISPDLSERNKEILKTLNNNISFIDLSIENFPKPNNIKLYFKEHTRYPYFILFKLFIFDFLRIYNYKKIVCLDCDILIQKEINELFELDCFIAMYGAGWIFTINDIPATIELQLKTEQKEVSCNAGVLVFSNKLNQFNIDSTYIFTNLFSIFYNDKFQISHPGQMDEIIICYLILSKGIPFIYLPRKFNQNANGSTKDASIVHFFSALYPKDKKPWNNKNILNAFYEWKIIDEYLYKNFNISYKSRQEYDGGVLLYINFNRELYLNMLPHLDLYTNKLNFVFNESRKYQQFFIPNIDKSIHYEISAERYNNIKVFLHVERQYYINNKYIKNRMLSIAKQLDQIFGEQCCLTQTQQKFELAFQTNSPEDTIFIFNKLVKLTYNNIVNIFINYGVL